MRHMQQEEAILRHLDGRVAPRVLAAGNRAGAAYLLLEWRPGVLCGGRGG